MTQIEADVARTKSILITKAKRRGIIENFGQKELRRLEDKYGYCKEIQDFDEWCMTFEFRVEA